jgi:KTSC domain
MMIEWRSVDSKAISAEAYDPATETIYVRFHNGAEWGYDACPTDVWESFTTPGQSRGQFLNEVLKHKPERRVS